MKREKNDEMKMAIGDYITISLHLKINLSSDVAVCTYQKRRTAKIDENMRG